MARDRELLEDVLAEILLERREPVRLGRLARNGQIRVLDEKDGRALGGRAALALALGPRLRRGVGLVDLDAEQDRVEDRVDRAVRVDDQVGLGAGC